MWCATVGRGTDTPFVNRLAVGDADVGRTRHGQPRISEAPAQRWVFLTVVHVTIDRLAVDVLHVIGKEFGDVFIGAPVQWHAQVVAILGLELGLKVWAVKQVGAEPVQVGELLVRQLVQLAIGSGGEAGADEIFDVQTRIGPLFASTGHVVGQIQNLAVAVVGADQVGVSDPTVINGFARLHGGLKFFNDIALADQIVLDLDAGDFFKGLGQRLGLVFMGGDGFRDDGNLFHTLGLQLGGSVDEPLHLGRLLGLGEG